MSKIVLRRIKLINWYGFINEEIPLSEDLTLITGENESGKSTILDAIKYAYTGDTKFNEATSRYNTGIGKRNLVSYTRCLLDPSASIYARPADEVPTVYTHIALEYFDEVNQKAFVLGVVIETSASEIRGSGWYAADGKTLKDMNFTYEKNGAVRPYDPSDFQKENGVKLKQKKEGIVLFMQMTGLKLPYQEVANYQRKLRNIMAYNPAAKIQEFIKESVLEDHPVKFEKLKEAKKKDEHLDEKLRDFMCANFYDIRTFGAVMTTFVKGALNCGQVRGPVQLGFARSVDPILPQEITITRSAITTEADAEKKGIEMGRKYIVPYGLYRAEGYISANLARKSTGFSQADLDLLWSAILNMFENDHSAARGKMAVRRLIIFKHDSELGCAPAHKLFELVRAQRCGDTAVPRSFSDYAITVDEAHLPAGVTCTQMG